MAEFELRNYILGNLNNGRIDSRTFLFSKDEDYVITGDCDEDCTNLDITIKNDNGATVADDEEDDDRPVVSFTPRRSERYTFEVEMYACVEQPCYFGFGIFNRYL